MHAKEIFHLKDSSITRVTFKTG